MSSCLPADYAKLANFALLLTRHDGVGDVEVVEGEAQGLARGGGGGAGCLGRGSGRLDWGSLGSGVSAGLQPVVLCLEELNLVLGRKERNTVSVCVTLG